MLFRKLFPEAKAQTLAEMSDKIKVHLISATYKKFKAHAICAEVREWMSKYMPPFYANTTTYPYLYLIV